MVRKQAPKLVTLSLKKTKGGFYHPLIIKARKWIVAMRPKIDNENGPDFWCWIESHYFENRNDELFDSFFVFATIGNSDGRELAEHLEPVATISVVPDDRDVGKFYGIEGVWVGGANIRADARHGSRVASTLHSALNKHMEGNAKRLGKPLTLNLFTQNSRLAEDLRRSRFGYEQPQGVKLRGETVRGKLYIKHFNSFEWWLRKTFLVDKAARKHPRKISFTQTFEGPAAKDAQRYIRDLDMTTKLLADVRTTPGPPYAMSPKKRVNLATFFGNLLYGEDDIKVVRRTSRRRYFEELELCNPYILQVIQAPQRMKLQLVPSAGKVFIYDCGTYQGYSAVVPCTSAAFALFLSKDKFEPYRDLKRESVSDRELMPTKSGRQSLPLILPGERCLETSEFIFLEGFGHVLSLQESPTLNPDSALHLFKHVAMFIGAGLAFTENRLAVRWKAGASNRRLPVIFSYANGPRQDELLEEFGFAIPDEHPTQSWQLLPKNLLNGGLSTIRSLRRKYVFDFQTFNELSEFDSLKDVMRDTIILFLRYADSRPLLRAR